MVDYSADCPEAGARHGQTGRSANPPWSNCGCHQSADCPEAIKPATVRLVNFLPIVLKPSPPRSDWLRLLESADCPEAVKPATVRLVDIGDLMWRGSTSLPIVLKPEPATVRLVDVGDLKWRVVVHRDGWLTSLPIVLKPKPATVRLVDVGDLKWRGWSNSLPIVLKPKPATVRLVVHRGGWLTSLPIVLRPKPATVRLVDVGVRIGGTADCPEAEARHGQTGECRLPIVLKPKPATVRLVNLVLEAIDRSGGEFEVGS
ncbi:hypothetical protein ACN42_g11028 [Penicillium freii]|uniref:Uncharacterized protein n=1 Tax=Penicillium freii TaxID=48697 RepID=A0A117NKK0_PENFR|nr:hypothetical protein ACN42_g11028 [Penicillium freii]